MVQHAEGAFEIDPEAVVNAEFSHVFRGYSIDEVRSFLEDVGRELHRLKNELAAARSVQQVVAATTETPLGVNDEAHNHATTSVGPGTVIDLQSHRLTLERDENFIDLDPEFSDDHHSIIMDWPTHKRDPKKIHNNGKWFHFRAQLHPNGAQ